MVQMIRLHREVREYIHMHLVVLGDKNEKELSKELGLKAVAVRQLSHMELGIQNKTLKLISGVEGRSRYITLEELRSGEVDYHRLSDWSIRQSRGRKGKGEVIGDRGRD
jgi:hypothetical protein